jgi:hypothetical protein
MRSPRTAYRRRGAIYRASVTNAIRTAVDMVDRRCRCSRWPSPQVATFGPGERAEVVLILTYMIVNYLRELAPSPTIW